MVQSLRLFLVQSEVVLFCLMVFKIVRHGTNHFVWGIMSVVYLNNVIPIRGNLTNMRVFEI